MKPVLCDSHIHLTDPVFDNFLPSILATIKGLGLKACSVTVNNSTSLKALTLFKEQGINDFIYNFVGLHPQYATENLSKFEETFAYNVKNIDGIGEIGLDPAYYNQAGNTKALQYQVFNKMLKIAETYGKPVSIHSRNSLDEILSLLPTYNLKKVCLHWFDGSLQQLEKSLEMGLYLSYGPSLVYSKRKQKLLELTNKERLLIETDGPVRYPSCFTNVFTLPTSCLVSIVRSMAELLLESPQNIMDRIEKNSTLFFD